SAFRAPQVILFSEDVERAAAFYSGLGFVERFRVPAEGEPIHVDLEIDGYKLGVTSVDSVRDDHTLDPRAHGQRAAVILWTDDVEAAFKELTAKGAPALAPPDEWLGPPRVARVPHPNGPPAQLLQ